MELLFLFVIISLVSSQNVDNTQDVTSYSCPQLNDQPKGVEFDEVYRGLKSKTILLVDVREPEELYELGSLPGSVNLPLGEVEDIVHLNDEEFETKHGFMRPKPGDENIVITCRSGIRATEAWQQLHQYGYSDIRVYHGSYLDWVDKGGSLDIISPPSKEHQKQEL